MLNETFSVIFKHRAKGQKLLSNLRGRQRLFEAKIILINSIENVLNPIFDHFGSF